MLYCVSRRRKLCGLDGNAKLDSGPRAVYWTSLVWNIYIGTCIARDLQLRHVFFTYDELHVVFAVQNTLKLFDIFLDNLKTVDTN